LAGVALVSLILVSGCQQNPSPRPGQPTAGTASASGPEPPVMQIPAPELQGIEAWINSKPLALKDLCGQVVVLHFWTFG
jgi:hypothetical protein